MWNCSLTYIVSLNTNMAANSALKIMNKGENPNTFGHIDNCSYVKE